MYMYVDTESRKEFASYRKTPRRKIQKGRGISSKMSGNVESSRVIAINIAKRPHTMFADVSPPKQRFQLIILKKFGFSGSDSNNL